jgi:lipopolysaccharide export LptBFGC system permease protein LptF
METTQIYIVISIAVVAIIAVVMLLLPPDSGKRRLSPLAGIAFVFVISGSMFGDNRLIAYGLIGTGILLALVDILHKIKRQKQER